ncbi:exosortase B [Actimicrobium sp. CCI2.3]|uniref:exosortase B n=1 Tax=Actimicrobium sp. CCI2.3 TaxID=3048616 RepID=UPI002AB4F530|nr:exosortase B [Actimicrobium sp. CCI2.3]MDY7576649.1 exosortase B [Actimicrobium sp. CCI2.3]MEB0021250.1 exosortase B [Actimicrobium sp. CCI2.3]
MTTTVHAPWWKAAIPEWLPIAIGLLALYAPTFYDLFTGIWSTEEQAHGPIIFGLALWLIYRNWPLMIEQGAGKSSPVLGWTLYILGLVLYILGRSQQFSIFEIGSFIVILASIILIKCGRSGLRVMWFPLFFMLFMIPLPGLFVATLTLPMKTAVSYVTEHVLYLIGYPISRTGVILQIGQYQLMVADACAGLHTLLTLEALGLFYLNLVRHTSAIRNIVLAVMIVPISFTANVIRVMTLTLITFHFGDAAGQGFLHGFAGMVLFLSALFLIIGLDAVLHTVARKFGGKKNA